MGRLCLCGSLRNRVGLFRRPVNHISVMSKPVCSLIVVPGHDLGYRSNRIRRNSDSISNVIDFSYLIILTSCSEYGMSKGLLRDLKPYDHCSRGDGVI